MKNLFAAIGACICLSAGAQNFPYIVQDWLKTNGVPVPPANNYVVGYSNGLPVMLAQGSINTLIISGPAGTTTNLWGPGGAVATNAVDFNQPYSESYTTFTPFQLNAAVAPTNSAEGNMLLQISNGSTTNVTGTWDSRFVVLVNGTLATSCTVTNGTTEYFWLHYTPANNGVRTNGVANQL